MQVQTEKTGMEYVQNEAKNAWVGNVMISNHVGEACLRNCECKSFIRLKIKNGQAERHVLLFLKLHLGELALELPRG